MKNFKLFLLSVLGILAITVSCTDSSTNNTWHPSKSMVTVITNWGTSDYATWDNYTIRYQDGGVTREQTGTSLVQDLPLQNPGYYEVDVFSNGPGFTYSDNVVNIKKYTSGGNEYLLSSPNDLGYLYTGSANFTAVKDKNIQVPVTMEPHMRRLNMQIYLLNDPLIYTQQNPIGFKRPVKVVRATMTGAASTYNLATDTYSNPATIELPFVTLTDNATGIRYLNCDLTMLGVVGDDQTLTLEVEFTFGDNLVTEPKNYHTELAGFNDKNFLTVKGSVNMSLTPSGKVTIEEYIPGSEEDLNVGESAYTYNIFDKYPNEAISKKTEGIVIWTTEDGKHGMVLGGIETTDPAAVSWAPTAEIAETSFSMGLQNTKSLEAYVSGRPSEDMGAIRWLIKTYGSESSWFIPSRTEFEMLMNLGIAEINAQLAANGFTELTGSYWSSETKPKIEFPEDEDLDPIPAIIYVWDGTPTFIESPAYTLVVDPANPSGERIPVTYKTRALRFF